MKPRVLQPLLLISIALMVAAIVVPTCQMVGCSMSMGSTMPWGHQSTPGLFGDCGGTYVFSTAPDAIVPSGIGSLVFMLGILGAVAVTLVRAGSYGAGMLSAAPVPTASPPPALSHSTRLRI